MQFNFISPEKSPDHFDFHAPAPCYIDDSSNTDLNSAWMAMGLRLVFDESTIVYTM